MIRVRIDVDNLTLNMSGHAGYGPAGSDIVCAGASMLAGTLAAYISSRGREEDIFALHMEDGACAVALRPDSPMAADYYVVFAAIREGFELLESRYPDHVQVNH